jgi:hypothetical protein
MPNNENAAQVARLRQMVEQRLGEIAFLERHMKEPNTEGLAEIATAISAAADALEREAWCEENKAYIMPDLLRGGWEASWITTSGTRKWEHRPDRAAAIDAARGKS